MDFDDLPEWLKGPLATLYGLFIVLPVTILWFAFIFVVFALCAGAFIAIAYMGFRFMVGLL